MKKSECPADTANLHQDFKDADHTAKRHALVSKEKFKLKNRSFGHQQRVKSENVTVTDKNSSFFKEDLEEIIEHCGNCPGDKKKKKVKEAWFGPRGSAATKMAARTAGAGPAGPVAGSPADRAAKVSAFEKQKAQWAAQKKAQAAALPPALAAKKARMAAANEAMSKSIDSELPPGVQKQRRPIYRPGEDKHSRLMQGHYPHSGAGNSQRSPLN